MSQAVTILSKLASALEASDNPWEVDPVGPEEFFNTFLREPAYPQQLDFVVKTLGAEGPLWDTTYNEGIALVGKGGGKDRTIAKLLVYICYKLLCLKNPQKYLGLGEGSAIDIGNVSLNARLAQDVFFKNFRTLLRNTINPRTGRNWFEERGVDLNEAIKKREVSFPKEITAYSLDSVEYTGEGLNLLVVVFDEVGGFPPLRARELYSALKKTQRSRFPRHHKTFLISYPRDENDYMMIRYREAESDPSVYRVKAATWDWNIKVKMEDLENEYARDPVEAKRVYQCIIEAGERGYIRYRDRIYAAFDRSRDNPVKNDAVWTDDLINLSFKPSFVPLKGVFYYAHIDLAKGQEGGDCAGLAIGHLQRGMTTSLSTEYVERVLKNEGIDLSKVAGKPQDGVVMDLVLQLRARSGQEILLEEIRLFLERLKYGLGMNLRKVTYDGWQSLGEIQLLNKAGIKSEVQSVDRDRIAYDTLKELIYKGLISFYPHPILLRELEELQITETGKVDHPEHSYRRQIEEGRMEGSKDVADAVAGVCRLAMEESPAEFRSWTVGSEVRRSYGKPNVEAEERERLVRYGERPPRRYNW